MTENEIGTIIVDSALTVHRELGPGLLESVYEVILAYELQQRGFNVQRQVPVAIEYRGMKFDAAFRADIVVENKVIIELKSVEQVSQAHKKQLQTYLRLTGCKLGFVLNFGEALMKRGITRQLTGFRMTEPIMSWRLGGRDNSNPEKSIFPAKAQRR
jgi:GxxExxY protein